MAHDIWKPAPSRREVGAEPVDITSGILALPADLGVPAGAKGLVLFAHGSGSGRHSPRNRTVAEEFQKRGLGTLLMDLLTLEEAADPSAGFDLASMASRLEAATSWAAGDKRTSGLPLGYFGASTGAAVALAAAAELGPRVRAVVSRGGRPDLVGDAALARVVSPTLLIVGGLDDVVLKLNRAAYERIGGVKELAVVPGASHLFEEAGALEEVAERAAHWFGKHMSGTGR